MKNPLGYDFAANISSALVVLSFIASVWSIWQMLDTVILKRSFDGLWKKLSVVFISFFTGVITYGIFTGTVHNSLNSVVYCFAILYIVVAAIGYLLASIVLFGKNYRIIDFLYIVLAISISYFYGFVIFTIQNQSLPMLSLCFFLVVLLHIVLMIKKFFYSPSVTMDTTTLKFNLFKKKGISDSDDSVIDQNAEANVPIKPENVKWLNLGYDFSFFLYGGVLFSFSLFYKNSLYGGQTIGMAVVNLVKEFFRQFNLSLIGELAKNL